jgi:hypothetical protein
MLKNHFNISSFPDKTTKAGGAREYSTPPRDSLYKDCVSLQKYHKLRGMHEFSGNFSATQTGRSQGIRVHSMLFFKTPKEGNNPFSHYSGRIEEGSLWRRGKG